MTKARKNASLGYLRRLGKKQQRMYLAQSWPRNGPAIASLSPGHTHPGPQGTLRFALATASSISLPFRMGRILRACSEVPRRPRSCACTGAQTALQFCRLSTGIGGGNTSGGRDHEECSVSVCLHAWRRGGLLEIGARDARAQYGFGGFGGMGGMGFMGMRMVPSPTDSINQHAMIQAGRQIQTPFQKRLRQQPELIP